MFWAWESLFIPLKLHCSICKSVQCYHFIHPTSWACYEDQVRKFLWKQFRTCGTHCHILTLALAGVTWGLCNSLCLFLYLENVNRKITYLIGVLWGSHEIMCTKHLAKYLIYYHNPISDLLCFFYKHLKFLREQFNWILTTCVSLKCTLYTLRQCLWFSLNT
jgi:hypothetical protein